MEKIKMILDCDTGHDDAIALMVASKHPQIDLLGVTVVAGNQVLEKTLPNTLSVCQHLNINVPVYGGMSKPMVRDQIVAGDIHGKSGLDGPVFEPLVRKSEEKHAVNFIIDTLMNSEGDISLVPVGPLTNIAMALRFEPRIASKIKQIVLMGGAIGLGNATPAAEFNILADPEAAHVVLTSGVPIVMMPLDLTNTALADMTIIERMEAIGNKAGKLFGDIMRFTLKSQALNGLSAGPVHDVTAVTYLFASDIYNCKDVYAEIELSKGCSYGRTIFDMNNRYHKEINVRVGLSLDLNKFWNIVEETLRRHE